MYGDREPPEPHTLATMHPLCFTVNREIQDSIEKYPMIDSFVTSSEPSGERPSFEDSYSDIRNILESSTHYMTRLTFDDQYLGEDANNGLEVIPPFEPEPGVSYSMAPSPVPRTLEERVASFSHCSYPWGEIPVFLEILRKRGENVFQDPAMYTILPAAKTVEMHWRRIYLHPDDFESRHFSVPRVMKILRGFLEGQEYTEYCYESGISPNPRVCGNGPVWKSFTSNSKTEKGHASLKQLLDSTEKVFFVSHEYRHHTISPWEEIQPIFQKIERHMDTFFASLSTLLAPQWN